LKIAYFSPLSPVRSGISDYSQELLPHLAPLVDQVDLFVDDYQPDCPAITDAFTCRSAGQFSGTEGYDAVVYQQGNNLHHEYIYRRALETPGVLVLHDYVLHHLVTEMTLARGDRQGYLEAMLANHGPAGHQAGVRRTQGLWSDLQHFLYPACWQLIDASRGVLVHSAYLEQLLRGNLPAAVPVRHVPMGIELPDRGVDQESRAEARRRLDLPPDAMVIGSFGFVTPMKQLDLALEAVDRFRRQHSAPVRFVVVGEVSDACPLEEQAARLGLGEQVRFTGYLDTDGFNDYLNAVDLALNLRYPTAGETSASLLRVMGMGVPVVVPLYRQYADIPDETCAHLTLGEGEGERLAALIGELWEDRPRMLALGERARAFVAREHTLEAAARGYAVFLKEVADGSASETDEKRRQTVGWTGLGPRMPAGSGPCRGDDYRRNSRVPGRLEVGLKVLDRQTAAAVDTAGRVRLELTNRGDTVWLASPNRYGGYVVAAARVFDGEGRPHGAEQEWQTLPSDLAPGDRCLIDCSFRYPKTPGRYAIRFDLLDVGISWFAGHLPVDRLPGFDVTVG